MDYDDDSVARIAQAYRDLDNSIQTLRRADDNEEDILKDVVRAYVSADESVKFLRTIPSGAQQRLEFGALEKSFDSFSNKTVILSD